MTSSAKHENKAYILHITLDVAEGTTKKLRGNTSTAVTWVDGKFLEDQIRNLSKEC